MTTQNMNIQSECKEFSNILEQRNISIIYVLSLWNIPYPSVRNEQRVCVSCNNNYLILQSFCRQGRKGEGLHWWTFIFPKSNQNLRLFPLESFSADQFRLQSDSKFCSATDSWNRFETVRIAHSFSMQKPNRCIKSDKLALINSEIWLYFESTINRGHATSRWSKFFV